MKASPSHRNNTARLSSHTRPFGILSLAVLSVGYLGCAASGSVQPMGAPDETFRRETPIHVVVKPTGTSTHAQVQDLQIALQRELSARGFSVVSRDRTGPIEISAQITGVREVSKTARILLGAFAGQAGITVAVTVIEKSSGKQIGSFIAEGKSSGGTILAGTTGDAVAQVASQIADYLAKRYTSG